MNKTYLISLVVPVYGVEKYIEKFARSVLSQNCPDVQYVFVDDCSPDKSMNILLSIIDDCFPSLKEDIVIVRKPKNEGLPKARKTGVENADGEYILFADSDDWLEDGALQKISDTITRTRADIVYFDIVKEYENRISYKYERDYDISEKEDFIINLFNYKSHGYTVTKCFKRSLYTENKIFTPPFGMHEDIYLMSQIIFYAQSLYHLKDVLYHYRKDNAASFCSQNGKTRHIASDRNMLDLYKNFKDNLQDSPIEKVWGGILMRAGWHAMIHKHDFFTEYPYLAKDIAKAPLSCRYRLSIVGQIIVKLYSKLYLCKL